MVGVASCFGFVGTGVEVVVVEVVDDEEEDVTPSKSPVDDPLIFDEAIKKKVVVRKGKRMKKYISTKDGFKIVYNNGAPKEVKMSARDRLAMSRRNKLSARKNKGKRAQTARKRKLSMKKRTK